MTTRQHVFLTYRAEPLPRWQEAFPSAEIAKPDSFEVKAKKAFIWLHLGSNNGDTADLVPSVVMAAAGNPVVVLANLPSDAEGLICLEAGAVGYITALAVPELMRQVVSVVENGGLWVGPELMARLRTALAVQRSSQEESDKLAALSQREKEVALAVAAGSSNKEIARVLGITDRTVKSHLTTIFTRLKVRNRVQLSVLVNGERRRAVNE